MQALSKLFEESTTDIYVVRRDGSTTPNSYITAIAPSTSSSLVQGYTASVLPVYSKFFYEKWAKGSVPIAPPYIRDHLWFYVEKKTLDQKKVVKAIATIQQWIDTEISMELLFNLNAGIYFPDKPERCLTEIA